MPEPVRLSIRKIATALGVALIVSLGLAASGVAGSVYPTPSGALTVMIGFAAVLLMLRGGAASAARHQPVQVRVAQRRYRGPRG